ncbi:hypothetical protein B0H66DRAFT_315761 [Apodospora peruviana]|uniref:F-box domain-containing protein n=1 Tax=Apodospora peruviana TaxID=516989 RepID=A0AAE0HXA7_9PEZI|nr:hypothetical protein B0H66DRAFT_315761 [Apodospora peruviana]
MDQVIERIGLRKPKCFWLNPEESIGERLGEIQSGKYTCWKPVGHARDVWNTIRPKIKEYLDNFCTSGSSLAILEMYMIGKTEATAAPMILICSPDKMTRKQIRKMIKENGFLDEHSGLGLGDTAELPDRRRVKRMGGFSDDKAVSLSFPSDNHTEGNVLVDAGKTDYALGERLYIRRWGGFQIRTATGGPAVWINGARFLLTVGHVLEDRGNARDPSLNFPSSGSDECSFDGDSGAEDYDDADVPSFGSRTPDDMRSSDSEDDGPSQESTSAKFPPSRVHHEQSGASHTSWKQAGEVIQPFEDKFWEPEHRYIGRICFPPAHNPALDYALINLVDHEFRNVIQFERYGVQRRLPISRTGDVGPHDADIVTCTASKGVVTGRLSATASYMHLPGQRAFQELYLVQLEKELSEGDCGAPIIDQTSGEFYGLIVAGTPGTGFGYVVPATQVFSDISRTLSTTVSLAQTAPPDQKSGISSSTFQVQQSSQASASGHQPEASTTQKLTALHITEFASPRYLDKLKQISPQSDRPTPTMRRVSVPSELSAFVLPTIGSLSSESDDEKDPKSRSSYKRSEARLSKIKLLGKKHSIVSDSPKLVVANDISKQHYTTHGEFDQYFASLPNELQVQILGLLDIPDLLRFRLVSRSCHAVVGLNESPLTRSLLRRGAVPGYVLALYPIPSDPSSVNLHYICSLWSRLVVTAKMASWISWWCSKKLFLRTTKQQKAEFAPQRARMTRRLMPSLLTLFHFLENYRRSILEYMVENGGYGLSKTPYTVNPIENAIISRYADTTLLSTHEIFPLVISSFQRLLRTPSYVGRVERSLRGYLRDKPSDEVCCAIICIGGLREIERLWRVQGYNTRRNALDTWYATLTPWKPAEELPDDQARRSANQARLIKFPSLRFGKIARDLYKASRSSGSGSSGAGNSSPRTTKQVPHTTTPDAVEKQRQAGIPPRVPLLPSSLANGRPMGQLSPADNSLLIQNLPRLQDIWSHTAEAAILERKVVENPSQIRRNAQVFVWLIREEAQPAAVPAPVGGEDDEYGLWSSREMDLFIAEYAQVEGVENHEEDPDDL